MSGKKQLKLKLEDERVECPQLSGLHLIPQCAQDKLISKHVIADILRTECPDLSETKVNEDTQVVHERSRKLFTILAFIKRPEQIREFLQERIYDDRLPLRRQSQGFNSEEKASKWILEARSDDGQSIIHVKVLDKWDRRQREKFHLAQQLMISPVFEPGGDYNLDDFVVLPFLYPRFDDKRKEPRPGGYSEILVRRIYPSHHTFWMSSDVENERLVAIKRLYTTDEKEFENERDILRQLGPHPRLIELYATYKHQGKWHMILPFADADLRTFWKQEPKPSFDRGTVLWSLSQMEGIAEGLLRVHVFRPTHPLQPEGHVRTQIDADLKVQQGEEKYGRHGDFKPENILWFSTSPGTNDNRGVLKIADFGLGRFHGRDSRSKSKPWTVAHSQTYEPPELRLGTAVSRAYDFWSLGCVFLEFATWLLKDNDAIEEFSKKRLRSHDELPGFFEDAFFTIDRQKDEAEVRDAVIDWVEGLHRHERCSNLMHDLLDLIMDKMLHVDPKSRTQAQELCTTLQGLVRKADRDEHYLLAPNPKISTLQSSSSVSSGKKEKSGKPQSVRFKDQ
ncbi:MAG: hypothetical protein M1822_007634 [Bathelium mastoideum]|nr:MAG: hypothetical protein M1822_007634 [Bathelium mastoideum]